MSGAAQALACLGKRLAQTIICIFMFISTSTIVFTTSQLILEPWQRHQQQHESLPLQLTTIKHNYVHMAHFQLGSFLIGLVSNWAQL